MDIRKMTQVQIDALKGAANGPRQTLPISRGKWYQGALNIPTDADVTFRSKHEALTDCHSLQLVYGNYYQDDDPVRLTNLEPYKLVKVVIEITVAGQQKFVPVTWGGGGPSVDVAVGATVVSDVIGLEFSKGGTFYVRAYVKSALGKIPHSLIGFTENGEGKMAGDQTAAANFSAATLAILNPFAIYATPTNTNFEVIACIGDSISLGVGNSNGNTDGHLYGEMGFMQLAAVRSGRGYVTLGMNGQASNGFLADKRYRRMVIADKCDIAINNFGTNDMTQTNRPLSDIQAYLLDMWKATKSRGLRVYQTTITPRTNAANLWPTEGQIPVNDRTVGGEQSVRSQLNNWIRSVPSPHLDGIIDITKVVEDGRNTGLWVVGTTSDGVHPNELGHNLMEAEVRKVIG